LSRVRHFRQSFGANILHAAARLRSFMCAQFKRGHVRALASKRDQRQSFSQIAQAEDFPYLDTGACLDG
jgi:hypothetical protein